MSLNSKQVDALFSEIRKLRGEKPDPVIDGIFKRLRKLERQADEMEKLKWKIIGAFSAVTIIAQVVAKVFL